MGAQLRPVVLLIWYSTLRPPQLFTMSGLHPATLVSTAPLDNTAALPVQPQSACFAAHLPRIQYEQTPLIGPRIRRASCMSLGTADSGAAPSVGPRHKLALAIVTQIMEHNQRGMA